MPERGAVVLSWIRHHGRSTGIADALGVPAVYVHHEASSVVVRYLRQARDTLRVLRRLDPDAVVLMLPPVVALLVVHAWATPRGRTIVGDLHSGVFTDPRWRWATRLTLRLLARPGRGAVVTNDELASRARAAGAETVVLHDLLPEVPTTSSPGGAARAGQAAGSSAASSDAPPRAERPFLLVPLSYAFDEPVDELLAAARCTPWRVVLTGRAPADVVRAAPDNVEFTGFVDDDRYAELVAGASAMVALTTEEFTMQRVGYEALAAGKALVVSDTLVLREYFGDAAVLARPTVDDLAAAFVRAVHERAALEERMRRLRDQRAAAQGEALAQLERLLAGS